ncbi:MAG: Zn-dependent hydrolase, partial [Alphaproteobacteria bacterium]|nr:Zn-dependent hydrolase [Alphaproteobacteria bacterium]
MTPGQQKALREAIGEMMPLAAEIFSEVRMVSQDRDGVTRPAWSAEDQAAGDILLRAARAQDLTTRTDQIGNTYASLKGRNTNAPAILTGSHLDSVARGGNFDGLAGAVAGGIALAAFRRAGLGPGCGPTALGIRCEGSVWVGIASIGARLAAGALGRAEIGSLRRPHSGPS